MLSQFFIDRPVFAAVLSAFITIAGAIALFKLPVAEYPEVVPPSVVVRAAYPVPTASEGDWVCVDLAPVRPLAAPVTLEQIKTVPALKEISLLRQSRGDVRDRVALQAAHVNPDVKRFAESCA